MAKFKSKITHSVSKDYSPKERRAITQDVVDFIRKRTRGDSLDKNRKPFKKYSKSYLKSGEFEVMGKSKKVNLTLSGDMMDDLDGFNSSNGEIKYGYDSGYKGIGKVEGHVTGVLGNSSGHKRDFLGISKRDFNKILSRYPLKDRAASKQRATLIDFITTESKAEAARQSKQLVAAGTVTEAAATAYYKELYGEEFE